MINYIGLKVNTSIASKVTNLGGMMEKYKRAILGKSRLAKVSGSENKYLGIGGVR